MELLYSKVVSGCVLFVVTLACGVGPFLLIRGAATNGTRKGGSTASRLNGLQSFASGIFLATCLLHLLPEAMEAIGDSLTSNLPVSEMIVSLGFLLLLVMENLVLACHEMTATRSSSDRRHRHNQEDASVVVFSKQPPLTYVDFSSGDGNYPSDNSSRTTMSYGTLENCREEERSPNSSTVEREGNYQTATPQASGETDCESSPLLIPDDEKVLVTPQTHVNETEVDVRQVEPRSASTTQSPRKSDSEKNVSDGGRGEESGKYPEEKTAMLKSFVLLFALSLHTVFDGLVVGLQKDMPEVWTLLSAIALHKGLVSVSISLSLLQSHLHHPRASIVYLFLFSLVAPLGLVVGIVLTETDFNTHAQTLVSGVLQSVATGTFMYVTFMESLKGRFNRGNRLLNVLLVLVGFGCVCGLKIVLPG